MKYILDTHILLWWYLDSPRLSKKHLAILDTAEKNNESMAISIMSLWEIAKLVELKKIEPYFSLDHWFSQLEKDPMFEILLINSKIVLESTRMGANFPKDPIDQLIAATAKYYHLILISQDERIIKSGNVLCY